MYVCLLRELLKCVCVVSLETERVLYACVTSLDRC